MRHRTIVINPGDRFGKLTVVKELPIRKRPPRTYDRMFLCSCDCGNQVTVAMSGLRGGSTRSCGCLVKERGKSLNTTDTDPNKRLKKIWYSIQTRCAGHSKADFKTYASRNIKVCDEWKNDFEAFKNWALSNGYSSSLSIDRIDNNKGYYPDNCRWATAKQQANNTRRNVLLTSGGATHTAAQWSEILNIPSWVFYQRRKAGWEDERILNTPVKPYKTNIK